MEKYYLLFVVSLFVIGCQSGHNPAEVGGDSKFGIYLLKDANLKVGDISDKGCRSARSGR